MPRFRHRSEATDVDHGQLVGRHLNRCAVVISLDKLAPVRGRATSGRDGRRLEWFAEVFENLPDRPWLRDEDNEPDVAATGGHASGNSSPTRARSFAQAMREVSCERGF